MEPMRKTMENPSEKAVQLKATSEHTALKENGAVHAYAYTHATRELIATCLY